MLSSVFVTFSVFQQFILVKCLGISEHFLPSLILMDNCMWRIEDMHEEGMFVKVGHSCALCSNFFVVGPFTLYSSCGNP